MKKNIFFKSVLRQPIRAFILTILIGASAFAFVARATEFIVVRAELARIEAFYRAVGILSPLRSENFTTDHDVTRALEVIENSRHVAISDTRRFTQGVLADRHNLVGHPTHQFMDYFNPTLNDISVPVLDHYFIGFLTLPPFLASPHYNPQLVLHMSVEELISGDPTFLREGDTVFTNELGQTSTIRSRHLMYLHLTLEEARLYEQGLWCPFDGLVAGERALFRASPQYVILLGAEFLQETMWYLRAITGDDGFAMELENHNPRAWGGYNPRPIVTRTSHEGLTFIVREEDTAVMNATLEYISDDLALLDQNRSTVIVTDTHDMTAMPRFMDPRVTSLLDTPRFPAGRFLTYEDYGRPVAVVPMSMAVRRNLHVGETFTITLRDNPRPSWIDIPTNSVWARGIENWWDNNPSSWWSMIDSTHYNWRDFPTYELELTVVGVYMFTPPFFHNFTTSEIFVPGGVIPAGFGWDDGPQLTGMYSFVLDSPRSEEAFLRETRFALHSLGFTAVFMPSGFETLAAATDPIHFSIMVNLAVFGAASALILAFAIFIYLRQWRRSVAIAQALGIPRGRVLRQLFSPVVFLWVPAMIAGSVFAWFFAAGQAEAALATIGAYDVAVMPDISLLLILCGIIIVFILVGVWLGGYSVVRRPVLTQLQGGTQKRRKTVYIESGVAPEGFKLGSFELPALRKTHRFSSTLRAGLRHSMRHVLRTPVKTALALLLALVFVFSLGWINNMIGSTEAEVARLWDTTKIDAEVFRSHEDVEVDIDWPALISPDTWDAITLSGFLGEAYLESVAWSGGAMFMGVSHLEGLIAENTKTIVDEQLGVLCDDMEIEFMPGFGLGDFVYMPGGPVPIVVRRGTEALHEFGGTDVQIIGVFDGGLARGINRHGNWPIYVVPIEPHRARFTGEWPFYWADGGSFDTYFPTILTARFTIDPARNREIDQFRDLVDSALYDNNLGQWGRFPLQLYIDDEVIYSVIVPMEQNLSLLRVLYPIAIGVAFLLAFGLSLLTMLQNAKNAAIMRVLGKPRMASQLILCTEQLVVYVFGVLVGLLALFVAQAVTGAIPHYFVVVYAGGAVIFVILVGIVMLNGEHIVVCLIGIAAGLFALYTTMATIGITPLYLAGVYFGGAVIGSVIGALVISMRAPLDLLQVKE